MRHQFTLSDVGLKLIKSYEGFRPTARQLETGRRVAGYGHAVDKGEMLTLSKAEAEDILTDDLAPYVALVNDHVFAPMTQGQFDALVSLAFNIGTDAFLKSDVLSAVNNGRVLDAANAFDVWRKGVVNGQVYVIDALVRRRTSEKTLFLRPEKALALAPRLDLPPSADEDMRGASTYGPDDFHDQYPDDGIVERATDTALHRDETLSRRREDGPAGVLTLSEVYDDDDEYADMDVDADTDKGADATDNIEALITPETTGPRERPRTLSPSAEVAADLGKRMDALMAKPRGRTLDDMPDRLITDTDTSERDRKVVPFIGKDGVARDRRKPPRGRSTPEETTLAPKLSPAPQALPTDKTPPSRLDYMKAQAADTDAAALVLDEDDLAPLEDIATMPSDSAQRYIDRKAEQNGHAKSRRHVLPFALMCLSGMILMGGSAGLIASGADARWGMGGETATTAGFLIGALLLLGSVYYVFKILLRR